MNVLRESVLPGPSTKLLRANEMEYEVKFPKDYVSFIKKNNGAIPLTKQFKHGGYEYAVERFLCMLDTELVDDYAESCYDIAMVIEQLEERIIDDEDSTGVFIIPVAALFSGDFLCLDFRENVKKPTVCIWYHEESECFSPVVSKVSNSFSDFIEMLY